ncbi:MAG: TetR/AcrR family transcriptional regulator [Peptoniphilaceae bacterium]
MGKVIISEEKIINKAKDLIIRDGIEKFSMRKLARECNISVGSIYNYFPSKSNLIMMLIRIIWTDIIHMAGKKDDFNNFIDYLEWLFKGIQMGNKKYPGFFSHHSLIFSQEDKVEGESKMNEYFEKIYKKLVLFLENDSQIRKDAFNDNFTKEGFVKFVFQAYVNNLIRGEEDYTYIIEMGKRSLY